MREGVHSFSENVKGKCIMAKTPSEQILARLKGLRAQMREGEKPLFNIPAIWENASEHQSNACDLVLTNQRLFGYIYTTFPRERLFLDALELDAIKTVSVRQKSFEAMFRELLVSDGQKRVYIRATRKKIEEANAALRAAIEEYAPATRATLDTGEQERAPTGSSDEARTEQPGEEESAPDGQNQQQSGPVFSRQRIRQPMERSPVGITLLLVGGLLLEVIGVVAWALTGSLQTGLPLFVAGLLAVIVATMTRRQLR